MIEAIITDITRMKSNRVCIAAIADGRQIRLHDPPPDDSWVKEIGGLHPGTVIRVDWTPKGNVNRPHVEDGNWVRDTCRKIGQLDEKELVAVLRPSALESVRTAYGEPLLLGTQGSCAFPEDRGSRSLASVMVRSVSVTPPWDILTEKARVRFRDSTNEWRQVPFQDLIVNQHLRSCPRCRQDVARFLRNDFVGETALIRVGLARAEALGSYPRACWLQVNHIFLLEPSTRRHFV
jgi:hypothetical protein